MLIISADPEDIVLGPPKTSFLSATSIRNAGKPSDSADRPPPRDVDSRDRYNFRKTGEGDTERTREGRNNNLRPKRAEGDQDSDGWSTVKPRKSFGTEGAERFNGRMGVDRHKDDRRFKDREDRDAKERPRGFDTFSRDKDGEHDPDRDNRRNGAGRGRNESWFKDRDNRDNNNENVPLARDRNSNGDRFVDRSRGWREKERDDRGDRAGDRALDRGGDRDRGDRRWDRDREQRQEREPEWMDEPAEDKNQTHTQEDFQKWKEQMAGKDKVGKTPVDDGPSKADAGDSFFGLDQPKTETPLEIDTGPDKFFGMWAAPKEEPSPEAGVESKKEGVTKSKTAGKASRFTSFFTPTEEVPRRQTEPPAPMPAAPPPPDGFAGLFQNNAQSSEDKEAFQMLLQKLHRQTLGGSGSTPPANPSMQPKPPAMEKLQNNQIPPPESFQQYRPERQEESRSSTRNSQPGIQELLAQRQVAGSQPTSRPEQMLQELMGQRQHALSQSSVRSDQQQPMRNTNTEFLMGLMQSAKAAPDPQRSEQVLLRMPPKSIDRQMQQQMMEQEMQREAAAQRERSASQRQTRPQPPPGFFDDPAFQRGPPPQHERQSGNPPQPTQILQRPPPPGLDLGWERQPQLPLPQHRLAQNIAPPPGLPGGPNRGMPMPQQMFPPGFPMGNFPPPDVMGGPPRNMQMQPPPGFYNAPPGFLPPGMPGFQGPEGMAFGGPYDGRGPPPQGAFRRQ
jgi:hypothetical protein